MRSRYAVAATVGLAVIAVLGTLGVVSASRPSRELNGAVAEYTYRGDQHLYAHYDSHRTDAPWVLNIHGGYWAHGRADSPDINAWAEHLRARGFQVFSIDYRLSPDAAWPAQLDDAIAATAWVRAHAARFGIDPDLGVIAGESAGGQIAAVAGLQGRYIGVLDYAGVVDPTAALTAPNGKLGRAARRLLGCGPSRCPATWRDARAVAHIGPDSPPVLIVHAVHDHTVPVAMSRAFYVRLRATGRPATLSVVPGDTHVCENLPGAVAATDAFLDRVVRRAQP